MTRIESTSAAQVVKKAHPGEFDLVILGAGAGSTIAAWTVTSNTSTKWMKFAPVGSTMP